MRKLVAIAVIISLSSYAFGQQKRIVKPMDKSLVMQPSVTTPVNNNGVKRSEIQQAAGPDKVVAPSVTAVKNTNGTSRTQQGNSTTIIQSPKKD